ncbi:MAG: cation diffusion facilitator family transporter [Hyphomicrobiales bacterium]|nr:cation diffusion facilitator family transporter [Hyphomicrobiales bacterium]MDE2017073.1 cation diffusion facilitator family transporter [Hyphomicrobiales bacterium]
MTAAGEKQKAATASLLASAALAFAKLAAGLASGSLALLSEAGHAALDVAATALTLFAVREADRPADDEHPFGHGKIEAVAALAETGLLVALAAAVLFAAVRRFFSPPERLDAIALAAATLVVSMAVDFARWRGLSKVAKAHGSDALAADALHFSSDFISSGLTLAGVLATGLGFLRGDALAAVGVACFIAVAGWRLGRRTIDTLIDAAPTDAARRIRDALRTAPGVARVESVRLRRVGPRVIGEAKFAVSRTMPLPDVLALKEDALARIAAAAPEADVTLVAEPRELDDETLIERTLLVAAMHGAPAHHVTVQHGAEGARSVSLDIEVDGRMALERAHAIATRLEEAIAGDTGAEVETHIEPREVEPLEGAAAPAALREEIGRALAARAATGGALADVHDVRVRSTPAGLIVNWHCRADGALDVASVHAAVDAVETAVRRAYPGVARIVGHAEPRRRG